MVNDPFVLSGVEGFPRSSFGGESQGAGSKKHCRVWYGKKKRGGKGRPTG